jgi:hypothetical protein
MQRLVEEAPNSLRYYEKIMAGHDCNHDDYCGLRNHTLLFDVWRNQHRIIDRFNIDDQH